MNKDLLLAHGRLIRKPAGETVFRSGDDGNEMFIVLEGVVEIYLEQGDRRIPVAKLHAGDFFGDMSLLEGLPRSGTAVTSTECELVALGGDAFRRLIAEDGDLAWRVMKGLSTRIRHLNRELAQTVGKDLQGMSRSLHEHAQQISGGIKEIAASAQEIDANEKSLAEQSREVQGISKDIGTTLGFIQHVSSQTHILGLNASIEAARSGEHGRGFGVIAEEIRKLSAQSKANAARIASLTESIQTKMERMTSTSANSSLKSNEQASATQAMVEEVEQVARLAERLAGIAKTLG